MMLWRCDVPIAYRKHVTFITVLVESVLQGLYEVADVIGSLLVVAKRQRTKYF